MNKIIFITIIFQLLYLSAHSQVILDKEVTLQNTSYTIQGIIDEISKGAGVEFSYSNNIPLSKKVTIQKRTQSVRGFLDEIFQGSDVEYLVSNSKIILRGRSEVSNSRHQTYTISGYIRDAATGEALIGASIFVDTPSLGTSSNQYGFYALTLPTGSYRLRVSFIGYAALDQTIVLTKNQRIDLELTLASRELAEVTVSAEESDANISSTEIGVNRFNIATIREVPALGGEVDVLRAVQLLPGVKTASEASSSMFVRGGNLDQNLVLLDEAPVYNPSHLFGIFSVFNVDAVKDVQLYKSGMPASYGGRLSSVLDVRLKDGNAKKFGLSGGIGLVSSRLTAEGPLVKDKSSFIVAGRYTYSDAITRTVKLFRESKMRLYFYDLSIKVNHKINNKNQLFLSGYAGADANRFGATNIQWNNTTATVRMNHVFNDKLFSNFTLLYSQYSNNIQALSILQNASDRMTWQSRIQDLTAKADFTWYAGQSSTLQYGIAATHHQINSGKANGGFLTEAGVAVPVSNALEYGIYASHEIRLSDRLTVDYGFRYSLFENVGRGTVYQYDKNDNLTDTLYFKSGQVFNSTGGLEPRISSRYTINSRSSVKASYNRTRQYLQLLSNSSVGLSAFDIWLPAGPNVKPQWADQLAAGYFRNFHDNKYETSAEVYYKKMYNQTDFADHARLLFNPNIERELRTGKGWAYGAELLIRKNTGPLTGWISYTYSVARKQIADINGGKTYPTNFDQPHSITLTVSQVISRRWSLSANWLYATGRPITLPVESYVYDGHTVPVYEEKNHFRLPDYHRLDLAATLKGKDKPGRRYQSSWTFSFYNAYLRKNATAIVLLPRHGWGANPKDADDNPVVAQRITLFPFFPSVTYNFKF